MCDDAEYAMFAERCWSSESASLTVTSSQIPNAGDELWKGCVVTHKHARTHVRTHKHAHAHYTHPYTCALSRELTSRSNYLEQDSDERHRLLVLAVGEGGGRGLPHQGAPQTSGSVRACRQPSLLARVAAACDGRCAAGGAPRAADRASLTPSITHSIARALSLCQHA